MLAPGGLLDLGKVEAISNVARKYNLTCYLTTAQNLRLLGASEENLEEIKAALTGLGLTVKVPGTFPKAKVCVGVPFCKLGLVDTLALSDGIWTLYGDRTSQRTKRSTTSSSNVSLSSKISNSLKNIKQSQRFI